MTSTVRPVRHLAAVVLVAMVMACTGPGPTPGPGGTSGPPTRATTPAAAATPSLAPTPARTPDPSPIPTPEPDPASPPPVVSTTPPRDAPAFDGAGILVVTRADGVVSRIDPSDGTVEPLEQVTGASQVTPSADGSTLVFTQFDDGSPVIGIHRDGEVTRTAVPIAPYFHLLSPDGSLVASLGDAPDGSDVSLVITPVDEPSSGEVDRGRPYFLSWRHDGRRLAANVDGSVLATLDAAGVRSPIPATPGSFQAPVWTADDRLVVVLESGGAGTITTRMGGSSAAAVRSSPIEAVTAQDTAGALTVLDPVDQSAELLARTRGAVSFDVAGDRVAWVAGTSRQAASLGPLQVVGLDGDGAVAVSDQDVAMFEWSPDGTRLLFHVVDPDRGFVPHVWDGTAVTAYEAFLPTATLATTWLPFWPQYALALTQWAPDGSAFAYATTSAPDQPGTVVVQALDGRREEFAPGEVVVWTP